LVLGIKPSSLCMLGKHSTILLHPQLPSFSELRKAVKTVFPNLVFNLKIKFLFLHMAQYSYGTLFRIQMREFYCFLDSSNCSDKDTITCVFSHI
jgi:hypothetical protein